MSKINELKAEIAAEKQSHEMVAKLEEEKYAMMNRMQKSHEQSQVEV
jgi:hypothetical protein